MRSAFQPHQRLLPVAACLYAGGLLATELLRSTTVGQWWPLALANIFGVWLFAPLAPLALLALRPFDWRTATWLALPLLLLGPDYGPLFLPRRVPESGIPLRVLTINVQVTNTNAPAFLVLVRELQPNVIAVQELTGRLAGPLTQALAPDYPAQAIYVDQGIFGHGVFSRLPIRAESPPDVLDGHCVCQEVLLDLDGHAVTLLNAHPAPPEVTFRQLGPLPLPYGFSTRNRDLSLAALVRRAEASSTGLLLVGDLNTGDREPYYRQLTAHLRDAHREAGWGLGFTFPSQLARYHGRPTFPLVRIDYILHDPTWTARAAWSGELAGSDHRYVVADLVLR